MAKKQKSFADKASGNKNKDSVYVKYVKVFNQRRLADGDLMNK